MILAKPAVHKRCQEKYNSNFIIIPNSTSCIIDVTGTDTGGKIMTKIIPLHNKATRKI